MKLKHLIAIFFVGLCLTASAVGNKTQTAESILAGLRSKITSAPSVEAVFTINSEHGPLHGSVILAGDKYQLSTPELEVWYDGKTQWTLSRTSKEVNITTPDADERMASNPFAILTAGKGHYTSRRLADSKGNQVIQLTPTDKTSAIGSFTIHVKPTDKWPAAINVNFEDGRRIDITVNSISAGKTRQASTFTFNKSRYPGFEIIDLR